MRRPAAAILVAAALSCTAVALAQDASQFTDFTSAGGGSANGIASGTGVTLSGPAVSPPPASTIDGSSKVFSSADFTPPLPSSDAIEFQARNTAPTYTLSFGAPVTDPVLHLKSLASQIEFASGTSITRVSGTSQFTVAGPVVSGTLADGDDDGTVRLNGTFNSLSFVARFTAEVDGIYLQVGVKPAPTATATATATPTATATAGATATATATAGPTATVTPLRPTSIVMRVVSRRPVPGLIRKTLERAELDDAIREPPGRTRVALEHGRATAGAERLAAMERALASLRYGIPVTLPATPPGHYLAAAALALQGPEGTVRLTLPPVAAPAGTELMLPIDARARAAMGRHITARAGIAVHVVRIGSEEGVRLQAAMARRSKLLETLSNILSKINQTSGTIVGNLKSAALATAAADLRTRAAKLSKRVAAAGREGAGLLAPLVTDQQDLGAPRTALLKPCPRRCRYPVPGR